MSKKIENLTRHEHHFNSYIDEMDDLQFWELASARQNSTGLPMIVWFQSNSRQIDTAPVVLVQTNNSTTIDLEQTVIVSIDDSPLATPENIITLTDLRLVNDFIILNRELLLTYWRCDIDTCELFNSLKKSI